MYPNPTRGIVNLGLDTEKETTIKIYDMKGNLVMEKILTRNLKKIDLYGLDSGSYIITTHNGIDIFTGTVQLID
ncbi:MAG: hypothetical protein C0594_10390 [Marinilabiliales bacterium]|nr:MAG: hypothetical protein C0594_10390 [Marinilabiliales bacterium]